MLHLPVIKADPKRNHVWVAVALACVLLAGCGKAVSQQDLDTALADFVNQMIRIGWVSSPEGVPVRKLAGDVVNSARRAFSYIEAVFAA